MIKALSILALVVALSACSTTPYEQVYIDDQGSYYIAETMDSHGYYVYSPVIMRHYGFDPWWYDRFYYSPYYGFYNRYYWPYSSVGWYPWYHPWYGHGPRYAWGRGYGGMGYGGIGHYGAWVHRPTALPPSELLDADGDLPAPVNPARLNPDLLGRFDRIQREQELMQRGRLSYRPGFVESPVSRSMLIKSPEFRSSELAKRPVRIDTRKLRTLKPRTWPESRSIIRSGSMAPMSRSVRSAAPVSRSSSPTVIRRGPSRIDNH